MKFNLTPPWTNTQTIVDGQGAGDLIAGANKINPNFNKIIQKYNENNPHFYFFSAFSGKNAGTKLGRA